MAWPKTWEENGRFVRIVNQKHNLCLEMWAGLSAGMYYWPGATDTRYTLQVGAPIGLADCGYAEGMLDERSVWLQVPHDPDCVGTSCGPEMPSAFLSYVNRGKAGNFPHYALDHNAGTGILDAGPVWAKGGTLDRNTLFPQQGWSLDASGRLVNKQSGKCIAVEEVKDSCPASAAGQATPEGYYCLTRDTKSGVKLALTDCSAGHPGDSWRIAAAEYSLVLVADTHGPSGCNTDESKPYLDIMRAEGEVVNHELHDCEKVYSGTIFGQPVMLAVTGIGMMAASRCPMALVGRFHFKDVVFTGTGGSSGAKGGVAAHKDCSLNPVRNKGTVHLGDVCVSHVSRNYDAMQSSLGDYQAKANVPSKMCDADLAFPPSDPSLQGADVTAFMSWSPDSSVSDRLLKAARNPDGSLKYSNKVPAMSTPSVEKLLADCTDEFWKNVCPECTAEAKGRPAHVFDYTECAELSSYNYWSGVPEDDKCRTDVAEVVNFVKSGYKSFVGPVTKDDVMCVTSMEAVAWMAVIQKHNTKVEKFNSDPINVDNYMNPQRKLHFTNVRAVSDYDHEPLCHVDGATLGSCYRTEEWHKKMADNKWVCAAYEYAGYTAAATVLRMFEDAAAAAAVRSNTRMVTNNLRFSETPI